MSSSGQLLGLPRTDQVHVDEVGPQRKLDRVGRPEYVVHLALAPVTPVVVPRHVVVGIAVGCAIAVDVDDHVRRLRARDRVSKVTLPPGIGTADDAGPAMGGAFVDGPHGVVDLLGSQQPDAAVLGTAGYGAGTSGVDRGLGVLTRDTEAVPPVDDGLAGAEAHQHGLMSDRIGDHRFHQRRRHSPAAVRRQHPDARDGGTEDAAAAGHGRVDEELGGVPDASVAVPRTDGGRLVPTGDRALPRLVVVGWEHQRGSRL